MVENIKMNVIEYSRGLSDHTCNWDKMYFEIKKVSEKVDKDCLFVEIGTREGGSALLALKAILDSSNLHTFITIDPYGNKNFENENGIQENIYPDTFYRKAMFAISKFTLENNLDHIHYKMESSDFIKIFPNIKLWKNSKALEQKFGYVFLDGEHNQRVVKLELEYFLPRLVDNGLIIIDDINYLEVDKKPTYDIIKSVYEKGKLIDNRLYYFNQGEMNVEL